MVIKTKISKGVICQLLYAVMLFAFMAWLTTWQIPIQFKWALGMPIVIAGLVGYINCGSLVE